MWERWQKWKTEEHSSSNLLCQSTWNGHSAVSESLWPYGLCSPPGSSVHGFLQARILERVAVSFCRGIFPAQGLNLSLLHLLHWQEDSLSPRHQGFPLKHWIMFQRAFPLTSSPAPSPSSITDIIFCWGVFSFLFCVTKWSVRSLRAATISSTFFNPQHWVQVYIWQTF